MNLEEALHINCEYKNLLFWGTKKIRIKNIGIKTDMYLQGLFVKVIEEPFLTNEEIFEFLNILVDNIFIDSDEFKTLYSEMLEKGADINDIFRIVFESFKLDYDDEPIIIPPVIKSFKQFNEYVNFCKKESLNYEAILEGGEMICF